MFDLGSLGIFRQVEHGDGALPGIEAGRSEPAFEAGGLAGSSGEFDDGLMPPGLARGGSAHAPIARPTLIGILGVIPSHDPALGLSGSPEKARHGACLDRGNDPKQDNEPQQA